MDQAFAPTQFEDQVHAPEDLPPVPAGRLRSWWRRLRNGTDGRVLDTRTRLLSRHGLLARGQRLVESGGAAEVALVLFDFSDLLELRAIYGRRATAMALELLVRKLERLAGRRGLAARTGLAQFGVLLPGTCRRRAIDAAHRVFGNPCRLELDLGREELVLVPDVVVDLCGRGPGAMEQLFSQLSATLAQHRRRQESRRRRVRRKREHHATSTGFGDSGRSTRSSSVPGD